LSISTPQMTTYHLLIVPPKKPARLNAMARNLAAEKESKIYCTCAQGLAATISVIVR